MNYLLHLLIYLSIYAVLAASLNIIVGYCGLLTLAHSGCFAIGAYGYALVSLTLGWGFIPATAIGVNAILNSEVSNLIHPVASIASGNARSSTNTIDAKFFRVVAYGDFQSLFCFGAQFAAPGMDARGCANVPVPSALGILSTFASREATASSTSLAIIVLQRNEQ